MPTLLVVDDEPNVLYSLRRGLGTESLNVITARTAGEGIELVRTYNPDAVILDVRLPDQSGLEAFEQIRRFNSGLPVIVITAYSATETAIDAMKRGAFDYLLKPVDLRQLRALVTRALDIARMRHVPAILGDEEPAPSGDQIVGRSAPMQEVYKAIGRVASQDVTVLIRGESGTGKELVSRALYQHSTRAGKPFLAINCAALTESLLESDLFGHERGAFTGADRRRIGKFEQVNGGTLFLDEIGDMSPATQAKILRLLQDGQFCRVGDNTLVQTDVRIIAATNQNLEEEVASGRFRRDLFYRLNSFTIYLPPLRERCEDIPLLVNYFINVLNSQLNKSVHAIAPEALDLLSQHEWPGNVRELFGAVRFALLHSAGEILTPEDFPDSCRLVPALSDAALGTDPAIVEYVRKLLRDGQAEVYRRAEQAFERVIIAEVLRHTRGNQVQASELLGISRTTLRAKLSSLGLLVEKTVTSDAERDE